MATYYKISGDRLTEIANAVRAKTGNDYDLSPKEMAEELNAATLEPLTVTPTTEEQTFTPESPCIGFSVVTVEAAPDTGGGDIVEPEELPNGETTTFGHIYASETKTVTKYNGVALPVDLPTPPDTTYKNFMIVETADGFIVCFFKDNYLTFSSNINKYSAAKYMYKYTLSGGSDEWVYNGYYDGIITDDPVLFTNKVIIVGSNTTHIAAMTPTEETVTVKVSSPVSREDEYRMLGDTMNALCHLAQEASKSEELMTPAAALAILADVVANMET